MRKYLIVLALLVTGCAGSPGVQSHQWTATECKAAGGILMCEQNWGRCECVDHEAARRAIRSLP